MAIVNVTLNPNDMGTGQTLSNGNLTDTTLTTNSVIRATHGKTTGKWYWEVKLDSGNVNLFLGVSNKLFPLSSSMTQGTTGNALNYRGYYGGTGYKYPETTTYGSAWVIGNVIGVALDLDNGKLEFYKNGVSMGVSHTNLAGMGEVFPMFLDQSTSSKTFTVNFGFSNFVYPIPTGYSAYVNYIVNKILIQSSNGKHISVVNDSYTNNIMPVMTGYTSGSITVSASGEYSSTYPAWKAFDNTLVSSAWESNSPVCWLKVDFGTNKTIGKYVITSESTLTTPPKTFNLEGSNDNNTWDIVDSRANESAWTTREARTFIVQNPKSYRYYRINIIANYGALNYSAILELEFMELISGSFKELSILTEQNFITHGINSLSSINPKSSFPKKQYIKSQNTVLGSGKIFEQPIDLDKYKVKKITFQ